MSANQFSVSPIGHIKTPFKQKFAIPRQPNLAKAKGTIYLREDLNDPAMFKGLEGFTHLWLLFVFHQTKDKGWKPAVKAPRLGGNQTMGVFASRSTHRPNAIGMSVVKNLRWQQDDSGLLLHVEGVDLLDDTPIVDIKPYVPYADRVADADDNLASYGAIPQRKVLLESHVNELLNTARKKHPDIEQLLIDVLAQDPRPAYRHKHENDDKTYRVALYDYDIGFKVENGSIKVVDFGPDKLSSV